VAVDRHGAVEAGTVGIFAAAGLCAEGFTGFDAMGSLSAENAEACLIRDQYNASNPEEDAAGMWITPAAPNEANGIAGSVQLLQGALLDDLTALGVTPATFEVAVAQAGPVVIPDTIKFDLTSPAAYPNGRTLTDPVVDITVTAVLFTLGTEDGQVPLSFLADLPLNPAVNDKEFKSEFPYLADPH
jgi:hypothetical protein